MAGVLKADEQTFREWLVWQLKLSRWSRVRGESSTELAYRLGVQSDALEQAMRERAIDIETMAKVPPRIRVEQRKIKVWIPVEVWSEWKRYCKILSISGGTLLRSICNHYLQNPVTTPAMQLSSWRYRGKRYKVRLETRRLLMARVPRGARQAIDHYASLLRTSMGALVRGLILDVLEGRTRRLKIVTVDEMWGDPKRYLSPEMFE